MKRTSAIAAVAAAFFVVSLGLLLIVSWDPWKYETVGDHEVRVHRFTNRTELRTGSVWQPLAEPRTSTATPGPDEVAAVEILDSAWSPSGLLAGTVYNSADAPVAGKVVFEIVVQSGEGLRVGDRALRKIVEWPAEQESTFVLRTGMKAPPPDAVYSLTLKPVFGDRPGTVSADSGGA